MSKKMLSLILCLSLLMGLFTFTVSASGSGGDNDISFPELGKTLTKIEVTTLPKNTKYREKTDDLDLTGGVLKLYFSDNSDDQISLTEDRVSVIGFDNTKVGKQTLRVTYNGYEHQFVVEVVHNYADATCTSPKTCKVCEATSGKVLGHTYTHACDTSCNRCTAKRSIKHSYKTFTTEATLKKNGSVVEKCTVCGKVAEETTIKRVKSIKLSDTSYTYNGKAKKPSVVVKDSAGKKISSKYYSVKYASVCKNVGTYKVTVTMKGKYEGKKVLTFKINPPTTKVSKVSAGKKSLNVTIGKKTSQVTGYEVQYSTSKKFKSAKIKTIKSYKTTKYTIKSLKAKKTYYVRVRTYKTVSGKKYCSGWSTYKYKKTKC